jgi:hypothetical protein
MQKNYLKIPIAMNCRIFAGDGTVSIGGVGIVALNKLLHLLIIIGICRRNWEVWSNSKSWESSQEARCKYVIAKNCIYRAEAQCQVNANGRSKFVTFAFCVGNLGSFF